MMVELIVLQRRQSCLRHLEEHPTVLLGVGDIVDAAQLEIEVALLRAGGLDRVFLAVQPQVRATVESLGKITERLHFHVAAQAPGTLHAPDGDVSLPRFLLWRWHRRLWCAALSATRNDAVEDGAGPARRYPVRRAHFRARRRR